MKHFLFSLFCIPFLGFAQDTIVVQSHDDTHMNWYGNYKDSTFFPTTNDTYRKIIMEYDLGCPSNDCSDWDYTNQLNLIEPTGLMDSTLKTHPNFKVDGNTIDSLVYSLDTTYSNGTTPNSSSELVLYSDVNNPKTPTDTLIVFPSGYYQYTYDANGNITDSTLFNAPDETTIHKVLNEYYKVFEIIHKIELGRCITPYGGNLTDSWYRRFTYDVTEFAPLLKGMKEIETHYSGWSDGFTATIRFYFIKGTPPRDVVDFYPLWHRGAKLGEKINGVHSIDTIIGQKTYSMSADAKYSELTFTPTGHGFGNNPENCAEFCNRYFQAFSNSTFVGQEDIWKNDCGSNAHYPQPGTWLYDRANWCPGEQTPKFVFDLQPVNLNANNTVNVNFQDYTADNGGSYTMDGYVVTYGEYNHDNNVALDDILAPSKKFDYSRFNPVCGNPIIRVQNKGKNDVTSLKITYSIDGLQTKTYDWTGTIKPMQFEEITLPNFERENFVQLDNTTFTATISESNGIEDDYSVDNTLKSEFEIVKQLPNQFIVYFRTNKVPNQNKWKITDMDGNVVYSKSSFSPSTTYQDTITLTGGCYNFKLTDTGKDGLRFGFQSHDNQYGIGSIKLRKVPGTAGPTTLKSFNPNFGNSVEFNFSIGLWQIGQEEINESNLEIQPNPSKGIVHLNLDDAKESIIKVSDNLGKIVLVKEYKDLNNQVLNLEELSNGIYYINVINSSINSTKKIVLKK